MDGVGTADLSGANNSPLLPMTQMSQCLGSVVLKAHQQNSFVYLFNYKQCATVRDVFLNDMIFIYSDDKLASRDLLNIYH